MDGVGTGGQTVGPMAYPSKAPVVGVPISTTTYAEVLDAMARPAPDRALVVSVCNVHSVMTARKDPSIREAIESSTIATPDGVPLVWTLRRTANPVQERVYGPEIMRRALLESPERGWRHYLHGSTPETLQRLQAAIAEMAPHAEIVGSFSPPFAPPTPETDHADAERIRESGANVVWVGLGMPKQEQWMHRVAGRLPGTAIVGVGAAFDFLAGTVPQAPEWMQRSGLEWAYRLSREPRRLWRRYLWNNPAFLLLMARQLMAEGSGNQEAAPASGTTGSS